jgi:hypothetical protein
VGRQSEVFIFPSRRSSESWKPILFLKYSSPPFDRFDSMRADVQRKLRINRDDKSLSWDWRYPRILRILALLALSRSLHDIASCTREFIVNFFTHLDAREASRARDGNTYETFAHFHTVHSLRKFVAHAKPCRP